MRTEIKLKTHPLHQTSIPSFPLLSSLARCVGTRNRVYSQFITILLSCSFMATLCICFSRGSHPNTVLPELVLHRLSCSSSRTYAVWVHTMWSILCGRSAPGQIPHRWQFTQVSLSAFENTILSIVDLSHF